MVVIAALVGAAGLGVPVVRALGHRQHSDGHRGRRVDRAARDRARPRLPQPRAKRKRVKMSAVVFDNVDIVFGDKQAEALALIDRGATRDEILEATGVVLGAAGVNLSIEPSEICVLMGLSGSGKSTILRAVNGLNKVARGKVLVAQRRRRDRRRPLQRRRAPDAAHEPHRHGVPAIRAAAVAHGRGERRLRARASRHAEGARCDRIVAEKLAMVGLTQWAGKFGHELSGGMQQRVGPRARLRHRRRHSADGRAVLGARSADPRQAAGRAARCCRRI